MDGIGNKSIFCIQPDLICMGRLSDEIMKTVSEIYVHAVEEKTEAMSQAADIAASVQQKIEKSKDVEEIRKLTKNIISITEETNLYMGRT